MSLFRLMNVTCPGCGITVNMNAVGSVNADRRPDLRQAILDRTFQEHKCGACGTAFRLQPEFSYLDAGRGQWIAAFPADRLRDWMEVETSALATFDRFYGEGAPAAAREVGAGLSPRVTFGWPAVAEKLYAQELGLDDAALEMLKLDIIRRRPSVPLRPGIELRLVGAPEQYLTMIWVDAATEEAVETLGVPRELLDAIIADSAGWQEIRAELTDGPFVDMQKLYMGPGRAAA